MGRKKKLRHEKKQKAVAVATAAVIPTEEQIKMMAMDRTFPKSEMYEQTRARLKQGPVSGLEIIRLYEQSAVEFSCVPSMVQLGVLYTQIPTHQRILFAQPWILEGTIRGHFGCFSTLMKMYADARPNSAVALISYWSKIFNRLRESKLEINELKGRIVRVCAICLKQDTATLVLQQCMGCSMYCYCSETCQTKHWEEQNHRGECKQLKILNKYHKPYAKEIRDNAVVGGSTEIPALEKLRYKLGLTRPIEEYKEFYLYGTHEGKAIANPFEYVLARGNGTLWIGSNPRSPLGPSSSYSDTSTTTSTTTTTAEKNDQHADELVYLK